MCYRRASVSGCTAMEWIPIVASRAWRHRRPSRRGRRQTCRRNRSPCRSALRLAVAACLVALATASGLRRQGADRTVRHLQGFWTGTINDRDGGAGTLRISLSGGTPLNGTWSAILPVASPIGYHLVRAGDDCSALTGALLRRLGLDRPRRDGQRQDDDRHLPGARVRVVLRLNQPGQTLATASPADADVRFAGAPIKNIPAVARSRSRSAQVQTTAGGIASLRRAGRLSARTRPPRPNFVRLSYCRPHQTC